MIKRINNVVSICDIALHLLVKSYSDKGIEIFPSFERNGVEGSKDRFHGRHQGIKMEKLRTDGLLWSSERYL